MLPSALLEYEGPVKDAASAGKDSTGVSPVPLVVFATAGSKGVIRVWSTVRPHPLHSLEPLARSAVKEEGEAGEGAGEQVVAMYTGLHYNESLDTLVAITYDQNIIFIDSPRFNCVKQVSASGGLLPLTFIAWGGNEMPMFKRINCSVFFFHYLCMFCTPLAWESDLLDIKVLLTKQLLLVCLFLVSTHVLGLLCVHTPWRCGLYSTHALGLPPAVSAHALGLLCIPWPGAATCCLCPCPGAESLCVSL